MVVPIRNGTDGIEVLLGQNPVVDLVKSTSFEPGADGEERMHPMCRCECMHQVFQAWVLHSGAAHALAATVFYKPNTYTS